MYKLLGLWLSHSVFSIQSSAEKCQPFVPESVKKWRIHLFSFLCYWFMTLGIRNQTPKVCLAGLILVIGESCVSSSGEDPQLALWWICLHSLSLAASYPKRLIKSKISRIRGRQWLLTGKGFCKGKREGGDGCGGMLQMRRKWVLSEGLCTEIRLWWAELSWTPGSHQSHSIIPLLSWTGEKKNTRKGFWVRVGTGRDLSAAAVTGKAGLT